MYTLINNHAAPYHVIGIRLIFIVVIIWSIHLGKSGVCVMGHVYIINYMYISKYISEHSNVIHTYTIVYICNMLFMFLTKNINVYERSLTYIKYWNCSIVFKWLKCN